MCLQLWHDRETQCMSYRTRWLPFGLSIQYVKSIDSCTCCYYGNRSDGTYLRIRFSAVRKIRASYSTQPMASPWGALAFCVKDSKQEHCNLGITCYLQVKQVISTLPLPPRTDTELTMVCQCYALQLRMRVLGLMCHSPHHVPSLCMKGK